MTPLLRTSYLVALLTLSAVATGCEADDKGGGDDGGAEGSDGGGDGAGDGGDGGGDGADGGDCPDADGDGVCDDDDLCEGDDATGDIDGDGDCNDVDTDDDGDGCADDIDADALVASTDDDGDGVAEDCDLCTGDDSTTDLDEDGECNDVDTDDDDDGCADDIDTDPLTADVDTDLDGVGDGCDVCNGDDAVGDTDEDGDCDDIDTDDDDDGCEDSIDANPLVASVDEDGDGSPADCDLCLGDDTTGDTDMDGICDDGDGDIDGDGCVNSIDSDPTVASVDSDTDGTADDCDYCPTDSALICAMWTMPPFSSTYAYVNTVTFEAMFELAATESTGVETIDGFNGASVDPLSGDIYVIARYNGTSARALATLDPATGMVTTVGSMGDQFAGITFDTAGTLYGVTGDGGSTRETLYTIDPLTGTATSLLTLGNGDDGEAIVYSPDDGLIYHASGLGSGTEKFESIDPSTLAVTDIPYDVDNRSEIFGLAWDPISSSVFSIDSGGNCTDISTTGVSTSLGEMNGLSTAGMRGIILLDQ